MTRENRTEHDSETPGAVESRTARLRTTHDAADAVAESLRPDNTDSIRMVVEGDTLTTTVERETTGGLQSTVDDAVVNLTVADAVIDTARNYQS
ncbi:KEOPS complex subunit Pcc1 [Halopelagius fulvigenes]|uniref:KEOPS complex subunit Pcc1 n=1 Tax=Halopelagius fulvigenes TaxID=1198324 RepID=A0ABD5TZK9_9EURY